MAAGTVHRPPYEWVAGVVSILVDNWEELDGRCLLNGTDLLRLLTSLGDDTPRAFNVIDSLVMDHQMSEMSMDEGEREARHRLKSLRNNGIIENGWSNDESYRQPTNRYPSAITPTENGYPGLEPPVG